MCELLKNLLSYLLKIKTVYTGELRDFETLDKLTNWCKNRWWFAIDSGKDCDDIAIELRNRATQDGYFLSLALVENGRIYYNQVLPYGDHMGNLAMVLKPEPSAYYIDAHFKLIIKLTNLD